MHLVIGAIVVALALLAFALYKQYKKTFVFDERDNPEVFPK